MLKNAFSYTNQLNTHQKTNTIYLHTHHPNILHFLNTKQKNTNKKIHIKTLSLNIIIPNITFHLTKKNTQITLFSPYNIKQIYNKPFTNITINQHYNKLITNKHIHKKYLNTHNFFQQLTKIQFKSNYPYIIYKNTINHTNPITKHININNLYSKILQINNTSKYNKNLNYTHTNHNISYNLNSLNITHTINSPNFTHTIKTTIHNLTTISNINHIHNIPSIKTKNTTSHTIKLKQINLHNYLTQKNITYNSPKTLNFTNLYFYTIT